jgi:hypothetical protein
MAYPNSSPYTVIISQTSGSSVGGQYPFVERIISGSNLFLVTDANGNLTGSTSIPGGSFTNLTVTGALTASIISSSTAITAAAATFTGPVTMSSTLSASGGITASSIYDAGALNVLGTSTLATTNITGLLSASGNITASNIYDAGALTVLGLTTVQTLSAASITSSGGITGGSLSITGTSALSTTNVTGTLSASAGITSSNIYDAGTLTVLGATTVQTLSAASVSSSGQVTGGSLTVTGTSALSTTNVTGLLSASGGVTASNIYDAGTLTVIGTSTFGTVTATAITSALSGSSIATGNATINGGTINGTSIGTTTPSTGNFTNLTSSNISSSGIISGSNGWFNNLTVPGTLTATVSGSITTANSSSVSNNNSATVQYITFVDGTGNRPNYVDTDGLTYVPSTNTLSASGAVSASGLYSSGNSVVVGDLSVDGGDITTTAATFSVATNNATTINIGTGASTTINVGNASTTTVHSGIFDSTNTTAATIAGAGAIQTDGGVYVGKNLIVSGSTTFYGDVTMYGTGSIINISSSNIIIGDNRIQLNAWSVGGPQRYGGLDIFDSGSSAAVTSSILWDSLNNYWLLQTNATGSPVVSSSAIILQGPTSSFGSEYLLTVNNFLKVQTTNGNLITSSLSEVGNTLQYAGTISASVVSGSSVYGATGSFVNLNVFTGSSPGGGGVPATPTAAGLPGQIEVDNNFIYVYTNNLWKRVPVSVWSA